MSDAQGIHAAEAKRRAATDRLPGRWESVESRLCSKGQAGGGGRGRRFITAASAAEGALQAARQKTQRQRLTLSFIATSAPAMMVRSWLPSGMDICARCKRPSCSHFGTAYARAASVDDQTISRNGSWVALVGRQRDGAIARNPPCQQATAEP